MHLHALLWNSKYSNTQYVIMIMMQGDCCAFSAVESARDIDGTISSTLHSERTEVVGVEPGHHYYNVPVDHETAKKTVHGQ